MRGSAAFGLLLAAVPAAGETLVGRGVADVRVGVFCADIPMDREPAPDTESGWIHVPTEQLQFHWQGTTVPGALDIGFGVQAKSETMAILNATVTVTRPGPGGAKLRDAWATNLSPLDYGMNFWRFDTEDEIVIGEWTFEARLDDELLYQVVFDIVPANEMPEVVNACATASQLALAGSD